MIEEGIYYNLSSEQYHGDRESISRSALMEFKKNPRKYWARYLNPDRPKEEPKDSWIFGTAFHTLILEPNLFYDHYIMKPEPVLLKDVGRDNYDRYKAILAEIEKSNKIVLSEKNYNALQWMQCSLLENPKTRELIEGARYESSYFWQDEHSGLMLKSRPDILHPTIYVDLKTIDDASASNYQREMVKYGYHLQAAMCRDAVKQLQGIELQACINICVEKSYPYSIGIYIIDEIAIEAGHCEYKQLCLDLKHALVHNEFNDYPIQKIGLPRWAY